MREAVLSLLSGILVGVFFGLVRLPVPAPPTLAGVMGIVGIFLGYVIIKQFI